MATVTASATALAALTVLPSTASAAGATDLFADGSGAVETASTSTSRTYTLPVSSSSITLYGTWNTGLCGSQNSVSWTTSGDTTVDGKTASTEYFGVDGNCEASVDFTLASTSDGDSVTFTYTANVGTWNVIVNISDPEPEPEPAPEPEPVIEQPPNTPAMRDASQFTSAPGGPVTVRASWSAPAITEAQPVTQYQARIVGAPWFNSGREPAVRICTTSQTSCTVSGLPRHQHYSVSVRAINGAGWSEASSSVEALIAPGAPSLSNVSIQPMEPLAALLVTAEGKSSSNDGGWPYLGASCRVTNLDTGEIYTFGSERLEGKFRCVVPIRDRAILGSKIRLQARNSVQYTSSTNNQLNIWSNWSEGLDFRIPDKETRPRVRAIRVAASSTTATLTATWEGSDAQSIPGFQPEEFTLLAEGVYAGGRFTAGSSECSTQRALGCSLTGLNPQGSYKVTVRETAQNGWFSISDPVTVDFADLRPGLVADVAWRDSPRLPAVWWSLPDGNEFAPVLGQHVEVLRGGRWVRIESGEAGFEAVGENRYRFADRGQSWRIRVRVISTVGAGEWTVLEPGSAPATPRLRVAPGIASLRLIVDKCEQRQDITYRYRKANADEWVEGVTTCDRRVSVPNLDPAVYIVQAAARDRFARSQYDTQTVSIWAPLAKPQDVTLDYRASDGTLIAQWSPGRKTSAAPARSLEVELWACGRAFTRINGEREWSPDRATSVRFAAPECLNDGGEVRLAVRAVRSGAVSNWSVSPLLSVRGRPGQPQIQWSFQTTDEVGGPVRALATWRPDSDSSTSADTRFQLQAWNSGKVFGTCETQENSCQIDGLPRGRHYSVVLAATNEIGTSGPDTQMTFVGIPPPTLSKPTVRSSGEGERTVFFDVEPDPNDAGFKAKLQCRLRDRDSGEVLAGGISRLANSGAQHRCAVTLSEREFSTLRGADLALEAETQAFVRRIPAAEIRERPQLYAGLTSNGEGTTVRSVWGSISYTIE